MNVENNKSHIKPDQEKSRNLGLLHTVSLYLNASYQLHLIKQKNNHINVRHERLKKRETLQKELFEAISAHNDDLHQLRLNIIHLCAFINTTNLTDSEIDQKQITIHTIIKKIETIEKEVNRLYKQINKLSRRGLEAQKL